MGGKEDHQIYCRWSQKTNLPLHLLPEILHSRAAVFTWNSGEWKGFETNTKIISNILLMTFISKLHGHVPSLKWRATLLAGVSWPLRWQPKAGRFHTAFYPHLGFKSQLPYFLAVILDKYVNLLRSKLPYQWSKANNCYLYTGSYIKSGCKD